MPCTCTLDLCCGAYHMLLLLLPWTIFRTCRSDMLSIFSVLHDREAPVLLLPISGPETSSKFVQCGQLRWIIGCNSHQSDGHSCCCWGPISLYRRRLYSKRVCSLHLITQTTRNSLLTTSNERAADNAGGFDFTECLLQICRATCLLCSG